MASSSREMREAIVVERSMQSAATCLVQQNYGRAFAHYLLVLKLQPEKKKEIKENFALALQEWSEQLEQQGRLEDLFMCYQQACELFPECETMLNNMGAQLFRLGYVDEAACCFRRALKIAPGFLGARENLDNVCSHLVERWHFRMLNDIVRNQLYQDALIKAVQQEGHRTVLDIGTGTGLLSLFAQKAGAQHVYACEMSKTMYEVACDVLAANNGHNKIKLIHKHSADLDIPHDIPERVTLAVTETFDAGLLGEHILETLDHAWSHLLANPAKSSVKPRVIPGAATVYICAIECEHIRKENRLVYPGLRYVDLSSIDIVCQTGHTSECYNDHSDPSEDSLHDDFDPYTTDRLSSLPGGYKKLTCPTKVFYLDFNDIKAVQSFREGCSVNMTLPIVTQGRVDAIAMWFELHLDSCLFLTSSPESNSCWEQAIFPVLPGHIPGLESLLVKAKEKLEVVCSCDGEVFNFQCINLQRVPPTGVSSSISFPQSLTNLNCPLSTSDASTQNGLSTEASQSRTATLTTVPGQSSLTGHSDVMGQSSIPNLTGQFPPSTKAEVTTQTTASNGWHNSLQLNGQAGLQPSPAANGGSEWRSISQHLPLNNCDRTERPLPGNLFLASMSQGLTGPWGFSQCDGSRPVVPRQFPNLLLPPVVPPLCGHNALSLAWPDNCNCDNQSNSQPNNQQSFPNWSNPCSCPSKESKTADKAKASHPMYRVQRTDLAKLNDIDYNTELCSALDTVRRKTFHGESYSVMLVTRGVSLTPLQCIQLQAEEVAVVTPESFPLQELLETIGEANGLDTSNILMQPGSVSNCQGQYDLLCVELVEPCGCLYQRVLEDLALARVSCLRPGGTVMPLSIKVHGVVIESFPLINDSAVLDDDCTLGFQVAQFMNDFQMSSHMNITLSTLDYKKLTEPFELFTMKFGLERDKEDEDVPSFLDQNTSFLCTAVEKGEVTAVIYWFDIWLTEDHRICTLDHKMHWKQAAVMQKNRLEVSNGTTLKIKAACKNSVIDVSVTL